MQTHKPTWYGKRITLTGGIVLLVIGLTATTILLSSIPNIPEILQFVFLILSFGGYWYFPHGITHLLVGSLLGIRFDYYFVGTSNLTRTHIVFISKVAAKLPTIGVKVSSVSLAHSPRRRLSAMFASGAVASMLLPFATTIFFLLVDSLSLAIASFVISVSNFTFTLYFSWKVGDLYKARRALQSSSF